VLKNLRFRLSFDDPCMPEERHVTITGDRLQLETLGEVVADYVQQLLLGSAAQLDSAALPSVQQGVTPALQSEPHFKPANRSNPPLPLKGDAVYLPSMNSTLENTAAKLDIHLQLRSLVSHELHLGTLANEESRATVRLSTLQLFDLANALDEYAADTLTLPSLGNFTGLKLSATWARVAAVLLALGVTTSVFKFVVDMSAPTMQTATSLNESGESNSQPSGEVEFPTLSERGITPPVLQNSAPPSARDAGQPANSGVSPSTSSPTAVGSPSPPALPIQPSNQADPVFPSVTPAPSSDNSNTAGTSPLLIPAQPEIASAPMQSGTDTAEAPAMRSAPPSEAAGAPLLGTGRSPTTPPTTTLFDTIPQVAEVRGYFQEHWVPPQELTQTLEYRLTINPDGSMQQFTPIGRASGSYVRQAGMPPVGERFVSPLQSGQTAEIRLILTPEGRVQTFLEDLR
jgi:hypothetical protein